MDDVLDPDAYRQVLRSARVTKAASDEIIELFRPIWAPDPPKTGEEPSAPSVITDGRPVRRLVRKNTVRRAGYFTSLKCADWGAIAWESELEKHALGLLECDPHVTKFITQPLTIRYVAHGRRRHYTPDILCWRPQQPFAIEIKASWRAYHPETIFRAQLMKDLLRQFRVGYRLWLDGHIYAEPRLSNSKILLRFRDQPVAKEDVEIVQSYLEPREAAQIRELAEQLPRAGTEVVHALLLRGMLTTDFHEYLTERRCVWLPRRRT